MNTLQSRRVKLSVDALEDRNTPSSSIVDGNLVIIGTNAADMVRVSDSVVVFQDPDGDDDLIIRSVFVQENGVNTSYDAALIFNKNVVFYGLDGNDTFTNSTGYHPFGIGLRAWVEGGAGDDTLTGGPLADDLRGGAGNDWIRGFDGNDRLSGGAGMDHLEGGMGDDRLDGGVGDGLADVLDGNEGADRFRVDPIDLIFFTINLDEPTDFNADEGDTLFN